MLLIRYTSSKTVRYCIYIYAIELHFKSVLFSTTNSTTNPGTLLMSSYRIHSSVDVDVSPADANNPSSPPPLDDTYGALLLGTFIGLL